MLPAMMLIGLGAGLGFPALMTLAMSGATLEDPASPRAWSTRASQVGGAIGLAVLATLATERTDDLLADGASNDARSTPATTSPTGRRRARRRSPPWSPRWCSATSCRR